MAKLSPLEARIIEALVVKEYGRASPLLEQLAAATADKRKMTGTGYFLDLFIGPGIASWGRVNGDASDGYKTTLAPPADLVGFTLFIRDGYMSWLEGYTFGDVAWPGEPMEEWLILEPVEAPHQKAK
jgi:hypothetical protein